MYRSRGFALVVQSVSVLIGRPVVHRGHVNLNVLLIWTPTCLLIDADLGYPLIDVPQHVYAFQTNSNGAVFFINKSLRILYPSADDERFEELDSLEAFTRKNIQQVLDGKTWFDAYAGLTGSLVD